MENWQARLSAVMKEKRLTQKQVSARIGIAQSTLAAWIGGRNKPGIAEFEQLAAAIDEDVVWLIWGNETRKRKLVGTISDITSQLPDEELAKVLPILEMMQQAIKKTNT